MKRIIFIVGALCLFATFAAAQDRTLTGDMIGLPGGHVPITHSIKLFGLELTPGTFDNIDDKRWGNTYMVAAGDGVVQGQMTLVVDYVTGEANPQTGNLVTAGTWTLAVYENGKYTGNIYGYVVEGSKGWKTDRNGQITAGILNAKLGISGGTGEYASVSLTTGSVQIITGLDGKQPTSGASLSLTF